jgi:matrix metalloproteinase-24 (membrane-inserted)
MLSLFNIDGYIFEISYFSLVLHLIGSSYWVFDGDRMVEENSNLSWLGLPDGLDHLDAALVWGKNKKTYFFRYYFYLLFFYFYFIV